MKKIYSLLFVLLVMGGTAFSQDTWYTLASGDWDDPDIWTLDPAGAVPVGSQVPIAGDNVVILSGKTVTVPDGVSPYDSPLKNVTLNCGSVTINGSLDLRQSTGHNFTSLKGNGRLLMADDNYPTIGVGGDADFTSQDEDDGTVVFYGNSFNITTAYSFSNLEIDMNAGQVVTIEDDLTLDGNLIVTAGTIQINNAGTTPLTTTVNGNVYVESAGAITVGTGAAFHWLNVYGDFTNEGSVDFSNSAQYAEATNGAVKLKFSGTTDTEFQCNGTADLYRLFVDKGVNKTFKVAVTADNTANFSLYGPVDYLAYNGIDGTDGASGAERLPVVIENGTLELGSNIVIDRLGENIDGNAPNEFTIPSTGRLYVNGADITTFDASAYVNAWEVPSDWQGLTIFGELKMAAGTFTIPEDANGIRYYDNTSTSATIKIEGGTINTTQLWQYNSDGRLNYSQSGGTFHIHALPTNNWGSPSFDIANEEQIFEMTGGIIEFSAVNKHNFTALRIQSGDGNYNVTGGTIQFNTPTASPESNQAEIYSTVPLYNIDIQASATGQEVQVVDQYGNSGGSSELTVLNDLTIATDATFNDNGFDVSIGGELNIAGTYTQAGNLVFDGAQDGAINNQTGGVLTFGSGLTINKDRHSTAGSYYTVSLTGNHNINIDGSLRLTRGALDVIDYWPTVSDSVKISDGDLTSSGNGGLELTGSSPILQGKFGKEFNFGNIRLNNTNNGAALATDVNVEDFTFVSSGTGKVSLGVHNLTVTGSVTNSSSDRYFYTSDNASDGGVTLPVVLDQSYGSGTLVKTFPIGTSAGYTPGYIYAQNSPATSGTVTMVPVFSNHPTVADPNYALDYFWRVSYTGLETIGDDMRYSFDNYETINVPTYGTWPFEVDPVASVFNDNVWQDSGQGSKSGNNLDFVFGSYLSKDYSYVVPSSAWGWSMPDPRTLYSRNATSGGSYDDRNTWSLTGHDGNKVNNNQRPTAIDYVIIASGHTVTIDANGAEASQLQVDGTLYVEDGTSGHDITALSGSGTIVYEENNNWSSYVIINADHSEFLDTETATIEYTGTGDPRIMPSDSDIAYYPNLKISGSGEVRCQQTEDVLVNEDLLVESGTMNFLSYNGQTVTVGGDVNISGGTLSFYTTNNSNRYFDIEGDIIMSGGTFSDANNQESKIYLRGNIAQTGGTLSFSSANIVFEGTESVTYSSTGTPASFYRVRIDKPEDQTVAFNSDFDLTAWTNGTTKSLILESGICHLNHSDIKLNLTTGGADFQIPASATLQVTNGATVNTCANYGLRLSGALVVDGGIANIDGTKVNDVGVESSDGTSFIEFTASGSSSINVTGGGELHVGDQIRRTTNTEEGILTFAQNGGTVNIGTVGSDIKATRGMFEILGTGSSFSQADGDVINIVRSNTSSSIPSLYFSPETVSYGTGSGFAFDGTNEAAATFVMYADQALNNIEISGDDSDVIQLLTLAHTVDGTLTIGADAVFDANGLDLTLGGDLINNGAFSANNNTTYFVSDADQTISGSGTTTFADVIKQTGTGALILDRAITVSDDLVLSSGTLNTAAYDLTVEGDLTNNITTSSTGNGIIMAGSDVQQLGGSGTFSVLTINNSNGVVLPTQSGAITFADKLRMVDGVFDIGRNLLVFGESAAIEEVNPFSSSNMIQTNLSFTDNGIKKTFPVISASTLFTYPIGSLGKYTPIEFDITANGNNTGSIRVKAADEPHISILPADQGSVLQYNWTLDADGISGFTADASMYSNDGDAPGDTAQYITARILLGSTDWNKFTTDDFHGRDGANDISLFTFSDTDDSGIDGDYTAGVSTAIPDQVPAFITVTDGNYSDQSTWATYDPDTQATGTPGVNVPAGGPRGSIIYVDNTLSFPDNFEAAYRTYINASGIVNIGTSIGHRLGDVFGTGTLKLENGDLPAGSYDTFFSASGGVLEYSGSSDYDVLSEIPNVNSVLFSGTGARRLPNIDVQLYGDLTFNGPALANTHDSNISIQGDLVFNAGTFDAGINNSTITFNGTALQTISGAVDFTSAGGGTFYNLEVNNGVAVDMQVNVEVDNDLYLTDGNFQTAADKKITLSNTSTSAVVGGGENSFVAATMEKNILNSSSFTFPIGDASRYGEIIVSPDATSGGFWQATYFNNNPDNEGLDPTAVQAPVAFVSRNEYWNVLAPAAGNAQLTLRWDASSGVNPAETDMRAVQWDTDKWYEVALGVKSGNSTGGTAPLLLPMSFNTNAGGNYLTFGSISIPTFTWLGLSSDWFSITNWAGGIIPSAGVDITIADVGAAPVINSTAVAQVNDLIINHTSGLTLQAGAQMTVNGALTTNDNLIIQNSNTNPSSFITHGTVTGDVTVDWTYDSRRYWYIGHSISNPSIANYDAITTTNAYFLYDYPAGSWNDITGLGDGFTDRLKGYSFIVRDDVNNTISHTGSLNIDAAYTQTLSTGWQLIANPYPAYYQLPTQDLSGADFEHTTGSVYVRTGDDANSRSLATFNTLTGISTPVTFDGIIAPGQSFWVKKNTDGDVTMRSLNRIHDSNRSSLKSSKQKDADILRLTMQNEFASDEAVIAFKNNGLESKSRMDSEQRFESSNKISYIYSIKDEDNMVINVLPQDGVERSVKLGLKAMAGEHRFTISNTSLLSMPYTITLEDKLIGTLTEMNDGVEYVFESVEGTFNDRFVLHFTEVATNIDRPDSGESNQLQADVWVKNGSEVTVTCNWDEYEKTLYIYSVDGVLMLKEQMFGDTWSETLNYKPGIYIVKITDSNNVYQEKVMIGE
ncbi:T9SS type A sorting domain-containing protein [Carboxylicivirga linearis]|uniref:T9SS type A sorting domain-containing protein n=1 Tax=Carboxylicivirga linearis TaxID=1628157 RepID=A0ABS5JTF1_9BACT|nr:T9SS type A sorting domain-containing protein [Carboxylicivirga linearis]MBS2098127.1 T9SS type A sorting domain-containing protein [Carboxylicivirga linearis]